MDLRLVSRHIGTIAWLIAGTMLFSIPWAWPVIGSERRLELAGLVALAVSIAISAAVGGLLRWLGRASVGTLFRKEAMAIVGLSWTLATLLGALPFWLSGTSSGLMVERHAGQQLLRVDHIIEGPFALDQLAVVEALVSAGGRGATQDQLVAASNQTRAAEIAAELKASGPEWNRALLIEQQPRQATTYRIQAVPMSFVDCLFEAQSGFSTTGATVLTRIADPALVPRCILFWRSSTHFLGGLGIIVLFVAILGQGSAGKALMRAEIPGPSKEGAQARMQHTAWAFAGLYCLLNAVLTLLLRLYGMTWFDALCHSFGTMATGGFSTYDASLAHFDSVPGIHGALVDYTVIVFMILAGTNFTLLYFLLIGRPGRLLTDVEWRTYMAIILGVSALVIVRGMLHHDFAPADGDSGSTWLNELARAVRFGTFQVVSIMTTTGYGTHDFNQWNAFGRGMLFLLMFVGGCAGSTGGGMKVIRHILFFKILRLEIEHAFHPTVVRPLRLAGEPVDDPNLRHNILVYFGLILGIFVVSWIFLVAVEPDHTWAVRGHPLENKLIDSASSVSATLNNIGPGLGIVGASENYAGFSAPAKILFVFLMMIGRLEVFAILVLFVPSFWRNL